MADITYIRLKAEFVRLPGRDPGRIFVGRSGLVLGSNVDHAAAAWEHWNTYRPESGNPGGIPKLEPILARAIKDPELWNLVSLPGGRQTRKQ